MLKMTKLNDPGLFKKIKEFLTQYLPEVRRKSPNTVLSYKTALNLFFRFLESVYGKKLSKVTADDFNAGNIQGFMAWLGEERHNAATTVNLRMAHIRQFCKYLLKCGLISYADYAEMKEIAKQPDGRKKEFIYLSIEDTRLVLEMPDPSCKTGLRDKFFIALLYDSGCRDQEMLDLKLKDLAIREDGRAELQIIGKGNKYRVTPVSEEVVSLYKKYCRVYHPQYDGNQYLFYTCRKKVSAKMSDDNVARFLAKYEAMAKKMEPDIPHLHAHIFRRSRAMHLYLAGVPLPLISEWLGHSQIETTQIYARASLDMKRDAADALASKSGQVFQDEDFRYDNDELIRKLYGLE